jgi:hypothetical protein
MEENILGRKKCRWKQLDLEELGTRKEPELYIVLSDSSVSYKHIGLYI